MSENNSERKDVYIKIKKPFFIKKNNKKKRYDEVFFIVYKTTNLLKKENEPCRFYVGQHIQYNKNPYEFDGYLGSGPIILNSVKKYGKENFKRETLEVCKSLKHMNEREIFWIEKLKSNINEYPENGGMNIFTYNDYNGRFMDEETKKELSRQKRGKYSGENSPHYGKHPSEETRRKMSENHWDCSGEKNPMFGKLPTQKVIDNFMEKCVGKYGEENPMFGRCHKEESIEKIKKKNTGVHPSKETKEKISNKLKGDKNPSNPYIYTLSNGENYFDFFDKKERNKINKKFNDENNDTIEFKGIIINRKLKDRKQYEYTLSNGEKFKIFFNKSQKCKIMEKFKKYNTDVVQYRGITITRIEKDKNIKENKDIGSHSTYNYELSNKEKYFEFFDEKERRSISDLFKKHKTNTIIYKDIIITRQLKEDYVYILSNGEYFEKYFTNSQRNRIKSKFIDTNEIVFAGITIRRELKDETNRKYYEKIKKTNVKGVNSKYGYTLSNGENFWDFFNEKETHYVMCRMNLVKSDTIIYKGITITRFLKDKGENTNGKN